MTHVDGNTERNQNKNTLLWQPQTCFIHMNVSFTENKLGGNKQLQGFLGILQATFTVYHWHHLFYFMVFYLQN